MRLSGRLMLSALLRISTSQRSGTALSSGRNGENEMNKKNLIDALSHLKVETGSLACFGCGHEHDCGIHGCAIIREAVRALQLSPVYQCQVCDYWGPGDPRCFCRKSPYSGQNMRANDGCSHCSIDVLAEVTAQLTASEAARADLGKRLEAALAEKGVTK